MTSFYDITGSCNPKDGADTGPERPELPEGVDPDFCSLSGGLDYTGKV